MKVNVLKAAKIVVAVAGVGITLAQNYFADKDLDEKVTKKVTEALTDKK